MLHSIFGIVVFSVLFSAAWVWALVWILERGDRTYRQNTVSFADTFLAGAIAAIFVYLLNFFALVLRPDRVVYYDILLSTALTGFGLYRETVYKARAAARGRRLRAEARLIENHLRKDPANAAWFERLSEVREKLGERERALWAARKAAELAPTVRNAGRVKHLGRN
jgi:cytochrome c-type biogenesis protein CcmH/NrfG